MQLASVRGFRIPVLGVAAMALLTGAHVADAQQQSAATPTGGLEEILVTAQKREQNPQEIGISLSAITGSELSNLGVTTATDITKSMKLLASYLEQANTGSIPVLPYADPEAMLHRWNLPVPASGKGMADAFTLLKRTLAESNHLHHPHYMTADLPASY